VVAAHAGTGRPGPDPDNDAHPTSVRPRAVQYTSVSVPEGHGMILIEGRVDLENTTYRVAWVWAWVVDRLRALRGERNDRLVRGADARQVG
jgi:hypothetical protein